ncbi:unnamed protein product [Cunninghamella echinulata]
MSTIPTAPAQTEGTIVEIDCDTIYAANELDPTINDIRQQNIPLYPTIKFEHCKSEEDFTEEPTDFEEIFDVVMQTLTNTAFSTKEFLSKFEENPYVKAVKDIYTSVNQFLYKQEIIPTNHHLFSENRPDIRCMAWHPHKPILAVAYKDHSVYIYEHDKENNKWICNVLKHDFMADITCMEWKQRSFGTLAVGCRSGVCVWYLVNKNEDVTLHERVGNYAPYRYRNYANQLESVSLLQHPHTILDPTIATSEFQPNAWMQFLSTPDHYHVSGVAWDPSLSSQILAVTYATKNTIMMYDLLTLKHTPIKRYGKKGNCLLRWSPDGQLLYVASLDGSSRLWNTEDWTCTHFKNPTGLWVKTACWSPDSKGLYYSMIGKDDIHFLCRTTSSNKVDLWNIKALSTPPTEVNMKNGGKTAVGGVIKELSIDPKHGNRLAISYEHCQLVALYLIKPLDMVSLSDRQTSHLVPIGYLRGMNIDNTVNIVRPMLNTNAVHISYSSSFEHGALLAVLWKNNHISFTTQYNNIMK